MQGMLWKNEENKFVLEDVVLDNINQTMSIFEEDDQLWIEGTLQKDEFNEYYFTDSFLIVYLYEGLAVKL